MKDFDECTGIPDDVTKQAHHIVPVSTWKPGALGDKLCKLGIDLNSSDNGVWLPKCQYEKDLKDQPTVHSGRHVGNYLRDVERRLKNVRSGSKAQQIINEIRKELCAGEIDLQATIRPCPEYEKKVGG